MVYKIIKSQDPSVVEDEVYEYGLKGWVLHGNLIVTLSSGCGASTPIYIQAMVRG